MDAGWLSQRRDLGSRMSKLRPLTRRELVRRLKALGVDGPHPGGKHQWMRRETIRLIVPNPHSGDVDPGLIRRLLRHAGISVEEWNEV